MQKCEVPNITAKENNPAAGNGVVQLDRLTTREGAAGVAAGAEERSAGNASGVSTGAAELIGAGTPTSRI